LIIMIIYSQFHITLLGLLAKEQIISWRQSNGGKKQDPMVPPIRITYGY